MTTEEIQTFLTRHPADSPIKISFKKRDAIQGMFIKDRDYSDLSSKNFWRIVTKTNLDAYKKSKDMNLSRIFHGSDFQKLSVVKEEV
ncbi:short-chain dehydrogenase [Flaviaesturariibacter aridisoli]|uniref:Short-chain dehydrogenase n=1 Tax=Flaviaesturariibacter aridisoli TaxID=2545761 RepID=A0A4R4E177_9BACT|nr:short-chain dehydrogenase [Flaviaesturariibacter aridisoli]TCZ71798.1 short-chain dehydrogenase [Flaviaesturariibacter aridisoli]